MFRHIRVLLDSFQNIMYDLPLYMASYSSDVTAYMLNIPAEYLFAGW